MKARIKAVKFIDQTIGDKIVGMGAVVEYESGMKRTYSGCLPINVCKFGIDAKTTRKDETTKGNMVERYCYCTND